MPRRAFLFLAALLATPHVTFAAEATPERAAVDGSNALAIDLYRQIATQPGNVFFSPAGISIAFAMVQRGAAGETAAEMARVLHGDAGAGYGAFQKTLAALANKSIQLDVANSLWAQSRFPFSAPYLSSLKRDFGAGLNPVDFETAFEAARARVNAWVAKATHQRIHDLLPPGSLNDHTRLVLANAIYFKGGWKTPFLKEYTHDALFSDGKQGAKVPMMVQHASFSYGATDGVQLLEMPYAGSDLAMDIVLPDARDGLGAVERDLTTAQLTRWLGSLRVDTVDVKLPRWKSDQTIALGAALGSLGMKLAFDPDNADFSSMLEPRAPQRLYVSGAFHKAFIAVDEKGSEAAAATGVVMAEPDCVQVTPNFRADHPFLYLIRDTRSGAILFLGRVTDPKPA